MRFDFFCANYYCGKSRLSNGLRIPVLLDCLFGLGKGKRMAGAQETKPGSCGLVRSKNGSGRDTAIE